MLRIREMPTGRRARSARPIFEFGEQTKQIATEPAAVTAREPGRARPIERLGDGIRRRNHL